MNKLLFNTALTLLRQKKAKGLVRKTGASYNPNGENYVIHEGPGSFYFVADKGTFPPINRFSSYTHNGVTLMIEDSYIIIKDKND